MMIRARNFGYSHNFDQEVAKVRLVGEQIEKSGKPVLTACGVQIASWAVQDYRARSEGRVAGGIGWRPITRGAAVTRLRARQPWKNDTAKLAALRDEAKPHLESLRRKLPAGPGDTKKRQRGYIAANAPEQKELDKIRKKRKTVKDRRKRQIDKEHASAKIGVDTGRLVNSLVFGVPELSSVRAVPLKPGTEQPPRAEFRIQDSGSNATLRMGSNMQYAVHFDRLRPIFPDGFIDEQRKTQLEAIALKVTQNIVDKLGGKS